MASQEEYRKQMVAALVETAGIMEKNIGAVGEKMAQILAAAQADGVVINEQSFSPEEGKIVSEAWEKMQENLERVFQALEGKYNLKDGSEDG